MLIIDAHAHICLGWEELGIPGHAERALELMDRHGIGIACVSNSRALRHDYVRGNDLVADALRRWPDRFRGYAAVNPLRPEEAIAEVRRRLDEPGFIGMKLHVSHHQIAYDDPRHLTLLERAAEWQIPVLLHVFGDTASLGRAADEVPEAVLIAGHMGGYRWDQVLDVAARHPNIHLETCGSCTEAGRLEAAVATVGAERVLFGTDLPLLDPSSWLAIIQEEAALTDKQREAILGRNMARLAALEVV
ncbi:MAG: amidohydrolase [Armatimonadetes bacterium]|nr:amidohydrolase [Armatimonadota bacterium]